MTIEEGKPAARERLLRPIEGILVIVALVMLSGQYVMFQQNRTIQEQQHHGEILGYINRAVTCDLMEGAGIPEPLNCSDPKIEMFRDPRVKPASVSSATTAKKTHALLCAMWTQMSEADPKLVIPDKLCER